MHPVLPFDNPWAYDPRGRIPPDVYPTNPGVNPFEYFTQVDYEAAVANANRQSDHGAWLAAGNRPPPLNTLIGATILNPREAIPDPTDPSRTFNLPSWYDIDRLSKNFVPNRSAAIASLPSFATATADIQKPRITFANPGDQATASELDAVLKTGCLPPERQAAAEEEYVQMSALAIRAWLLNRTRQICLDNVCEQEARIQKLTGNLFKRAARVLIAPLTPERTRSRKASIANLTELRDKSHFARNWAAQQRLATEKQLPAIWKHLLGDEAVVSTHIGLARRVLDSLYQQQETAWQKHIRRDRASA
jgi:hypothetical protein